MTSRFESAARGYAYRPGCDGINGAGEPPHTDEAEYHAFLAGAEHGYTVGNQQGYQDGYKAALKTFESVKAEERKRIIEALRKHALTGPDEAFWCSWAVNWLESELPKLDQRSEGK